jgi:hypothetical protein
MNEAAKIVPQFSEEVTKKDLARFHSKYRKDGPVPDPALYGDIGACWVWTGTLRLDGYGHFKMKRKLYGAHRFFWMLRHGEIPKGLCVMHLCDRPLCVNPAHLRIGTSAENTADRHAKGRSASGDKNGSRTRPDRVRRGEENGCAILTEDLVREIRRLVGTGLTRKEVGERLGIKAPTVYAVASRRLWRHVL